MELKKRQQTKKNKDTERIKGTKLTSCSKLHVRMASRSRNTPSPSTLPVYSARSKDTYKENVILLT